MLKEILKPNGIKHTLIASIHSIKQNKVLAIIYFFKLEQAY